MKLILVCLSLVVSMIFLEKPATAHVLITDDTSSKGAILHISPDDDPVAGQPATIFFDLQENFDKNTDSVDLVVRDAAGKNSNVKAKTEGTLATANYVFLEQGVYELEFTVTSSSGNKYTFRQSQRITRGALQGAAVNSKKHNWAEIALLASGLGFVTLSIIVFNRRKDIAMQSKW